MADEDVRSEPSTSGEKPWVLSCRSPLRTNSVVSVLCSCFVLSSPLGVSSKQLPLAWACSWPVAFLPASQLGKQFCYTRAFTTLYVLTASKFSRRYSSRVPVRDQRSSTSWVYRRTLGSQSVMRHHGLQLGWLRLQLCSLRPDPVAPSSVSPVHTEVCTVTWTTNVSWW
jgi:hypothetical protein